MEIFSSEIKRRVLYKHYLMCSWKEYFSHTDEYLNKKVSDGGLPCNFF